MMRYAFLLLLLLFTQEISASENDTTVVELQLMQNEKGRLAIKVIPPTKGNNPWTYIIPKIVPGTYMKINYKRLYKDLKAYSTKGEELKIKKRDNVFYIKDKGKQLGYLTYEIKQTTGHGPVWDNILGCAGTVFTDSSYLLNFQVVNGYFEDFQDKPVKLVVNKTKPLYGSGALKAIKRSDQQDVYVSATYDELIDSPMLFNKPDTASFEINGNHFKIATHSELGNVTSAAMKPALHRIMAAVDSFSGFTNDEDYYFLFYYLDKDRLKGLFGSFGLGSALEHKHSSVYYFSDHGYYDSAYRNLDWIVSHEYFHTISPLNLHSEKIRDFNFAQTDMSRHLWLYEGTTDYLSALMNSQYDLSNGLRSALNLSIDFNDKRKERSLTKSSQYIIKSNVTNWISKILQLANFYEKGKLVSWGIDMELTKRSNGELRFLDVLLRMKEDYKDKPMPDDQVIDILTEYTYPDMRDYYVKYIDGKETIPYEKYLDWLGWEYIEKGTEVPAFATKLQLRYSVEKDQYTVKKVGTNTLGLKNGDVIESVDGVNANLQNARNEGFIGKIRRPKSATEEIAVIVRRGDKSLALAGKALLTDKLRFSQIEEKKEITPEQEDFKALFFNKE